MSRAQVAHRLDGPVAGGSPTTGTLERGDGRRPGATSTLPAPKRGSRRELRPEPRQRRSRTSASTAPRVDDDLAGLGARGAGSRAAARGSPASTRTVGERADAARPDVHPEHRRRRARAARRRQRQAERRPAHDARRRSRPRSGPPVRLLDRSAGRERDAQRVRRGRRAAPARPAAA